MNTQLESINWATDFLRSKDYALLTAPAVVVETPWSIVVRFATNRGDIYLKQTPPALALEAKIIRLLAQQFHASVPTVLAEQEDLHCFLMQDAGITLRKYLQSVPEAEDEPDLLFKSIRNYTAVQRSVEMQVEAFLTLGVPDWRLDKLPQLYNAMLSDSELLIADGITDKELQTLQTLSPTFAEQCALLARYSIVETLVQQDFHTNNILIDPDTLKMTFVDLGETVITHPFFSLHTFLRQAITHHGVSQLDHTYSLLQQVYIEGWSKSAERYAILEAFMFSKKLWPIYSALGCYRLMKAVDLEAYETYYADRPNQLSGYIREYLPARR